MKTLYLHKIKLKFFFLKNIIQNFIFNCVLLYQRHLIAGLLLCQVKVGRSEIGHTKRLTKTDKCFEWSTFLKFRWIFTHFTDDTHIVTMREIDFKVDYSIFSGLSNFTGFLGILQHRTSGFGSPILRKPFFPLAIQGIDSSHHGRSYT